MKLILSLILILLFVSCKSDNVESHCYIAKSNDTYEYPIKPGVNEWAQLSSSEKNTACQIPDNTLKNISTEGLIESVLFNPLFAEIYLSNEHIQAGFNAFYENFNGIRELLKRSDTVAKILCRYLQMDPACNKNNWPSLTGAGSNNNYAFSYIEIIIAQYPIVDQIVNSGKAKTVIQEILNKNEVKGKYCYSVVGLEHSSLIAGRIMYLCNYRPFIDEYNNDQNVRIFISGAMIVDITTLDVVTNCAKKFIIEK
jgi:hypothetical protein